MQWVDMRLPMDDSDFFVFLTDLLPPGIWGVIKTNPDDTCTILINKNLLHEQQLQTYWHEYEHLAYDDFGNGRPISEIESRK